MSQISNLGSTAISGIVGAQVVSVINKVLKAKYGVELTVDDVTTIIGFAPGAVHTIAILPEALILWAAGIKETWRNAFRPSAPSGTPAAPAAN